LSCRGFLLTTVDKKNNLAKIVMEKIRYTIQAGFGFYRFHTLQYLLGRGALLWQTGERV